MTLSAVSATRVPCLACQTFGPAGRLRVEAPRSEILSDGNSLDDALLSFAESRDLEAGQTSGSELAIRAKSRTWLRQTDDGQIDLRSKSWLKFSYEFESADGTKVTLKGRAKAQISYHQTADGSFELKARVKFQLAAVVETVASGLSPVLGSEEVADQEQSAILAALDGFREMVDGLAGRFMDGALSGDDLIGAVVNAFNQLTELAQSSLFAEAGLPSASAEEPAPALPDPVTDSGTPPLAPTEQPASSTDAATGESNPGTDTAGLPAEDETVTGPTGAVDETADTEAVEAEATCPPVASESSPQTEIPAATAAYSRQWLFVKLRLKFVQSMSHLVATLDPSSDAAGVVANSSARMRLDLRLAAYSQTQAWLEGVPGLYVDAEA